MFGDVIDEQKIVDGLTLIVNIAINRIQDEILAKKRIKITIPSPILIEVVDKEKPKCDNT
jgi:hypothetical protein